jgi:hypothetical protein
MAPTSLTRGGMEAPWIISEYVCEKFYDGGVVIDNKDTNIGHGDWPEKYPILSEEALQLLTCYAAVSFRGLEGRKPAASNPALQGRDRGLTVADSLSGA